MDVLKWVRWVACAMLACTLSFAQDARPLQQETILHKVYAGIIQEKIDAANVFLVDIGRKDQVALYYADAITAKFSSDLILIRPSTVAAVETPGKKGQLGKVGRKVLVQVFKEATGTTRARVTTNVGLDTGSLILLYPMNGIAASKVSTPQVQAWAKNAGVPENWGLIVKKSASQATPDELDHQLEAAKKRFQAIMQEMGASPGPRLLGE